MSGKLTRRKTTDQQADQLLTSLSEEAQAYRREHGIAAPKFVPIDDFPNSAPPGWTWARLSALFRVITDGDHLPPPKAERGVPFLTISNMTAGTVDFSNCRHVDPAYFVALPEHKKPRRGDILYSIVGATLGRPAVVTTDTEFCVQRHIAILKPCTGMNTAFLRLLLASPMLYAQATKSATGTAQPTVPLRALRDFLVLLPPAEEQSRIVAKVTEITALCDRLEAQIAAVENASSRLLDALLHEALEAREINPVLEKR